MWTQSQIKRTLSQPQALDRLCALRAGEPEARRTALADQLCAEFGFVGVVSSG